MPEKTKGPDGAGRRALHINWTISSIPSLDPEPKHSLTSAANVLAAVRISDVYLELTGVAPKHGRAAAVWRDGKRLSVALSDAKGTWYDHAAGEGGGVLDLVARIRRCDGAQALKWVAALAGVALEDRPLSRAGRQRYAREKADLPVAELWRRAACAMAEQVMCDLKTALFDPLAEADPRPLIAEIQWLERRLRHWRRITGAELVEAYRGFRAADPTLTDAMLQAVLRRQRIEERTLWRALLGVCE